MSLDSRVELIPNAAGRRVPAGVGAGPYAGIGAVRPVGRHHAPPIRTREDYPADGDKIVLDLKTALERFGLRDGMTVSTHHHFRDGDFVAAKLFAAAHELGVRDLVWFPSAVFPCHADLLPYLENGTIHHIEGSLNGPLGAYASEGRMRGVAMLRSHGSRYRAIQDGEVRVDLAVIAAPSADAFGNLTGASGPAACGGLGFAEADARYADRVIAVTDHLVPFPCAPWQIAGVLVDAVVVVDRIGDPERIVSGTTRMTRSPERLLIAELCARFADAAGIVRDGWSFQAGAGGTSLAFTMFARDLMRERGVRARFIRGGGNRSIVEMLEEGLTEYVLDGQTFDLEAVRSLRENPRHLMTSPFVSYNPHGKGNIASLIDLALLGATEVAEDFSANVVSHSDGRMLHGLGGWQDALSARCTVLAVPTFRNRVPILRERTTTLCGPGELVDVVVTERGIAIRPQRDDLLAAVAGKGLPLTTLAELRRGAEAMCGGPPREASREGPVVGLVTWTDGTILDALHETPPLPPEP